MQLVRTLCYSFVQPERSIDYDGMLSVFCFCSCFGAHLPSSCCVLLFCLRPSLRLHFSYGPNRLTTNRDTENDMQQHVHRFTPTMSNDPTMTSNTVYNLCHFRPPPYMFYTGLCMPSSLIWTSKPIFKGSTSRGGAAR